MAWFIVFGVVVVGWWLVARSRRRQTAGVAAVVIPVHRVRVPVLKVLGGLVLLAMIYAVYVGLTSLYLRTHPPFLVFWWEFVALFDMMLFIPLLPVVLPEAYKQYLEQKPKGQHSLLDYVVGLWTTALMFGGAGVHVAILASSPNWQFYPS